MSRAISVVSESSDHYLYLYDDESIDEIITDMKECCDFSLFYIKNVLSKTHDVSELTQKVGEAIDIANTEEYGN